MQTQTRRETILSLLISSRNVAAGTPALGAGGADLIGPAADTWRDVSDDVRKTGP